MVFIFDNCISSFDTEASIEKYPPLTPNPPEYQIFKGYLNFMLDAKEHFQTSHIFVHVDELVHTKACDMLWKEKNLYFYDLYFYKLRVMQCLLFK